MDWSRFHNRRRQKALGPLAGCDSLRSSLASLAAVLASPRSASGPRPFDPPGPPPNRSHTPPQPTAVLGPPAPRSSSTGRRSCSLAPLSRLTSFAVRAVRGLTSFGLALPARACDFRAPARFARGNLARWCLAASLRSARSTARHMAVGARRRGARAAPAPREGRPTERSEGGSRLGRARPRYLVD